ncbi:MAG: glucokinase [Terriglobales bacterium]
MILAGDIGGTHARLSYYRLNNDNGRFAAVHEHVFNSREFRGLDEIALKFVSETGVRPSIASFGVAGPVRNGRVETSNLPWVVESSRLARELQLDSVDLINDLEAQAWGIQCLGPSDTVALNQISSNQISSNQIPPNHISRQNPAGNQAVVAAGTGLGEAGLIWDGEHQHIFACEGGHCDFAPRNELEIELLRYLLTRFGHVSYERIVSGPGLVNVYLFLKDTHRGSEPQWLRDEIAAGDPAAAISRAAVSAKAPLAEQALDLWISIYGAEAGNMSLKVLATGGVFLAGGIAPKILPKLAGPLFMQAFLSKGRLQPLLEAIPVRVITNEKTGLLGAAGYGARHARIRASNISANHISSNTVA